MRRFLSPVSIVALVALLCFVAASIFSWLTSPPDYRYHSSLVGFAIFAFLFAPPVVTACAPRLALLIWVPGMLYWLHLVGIEAENGDMGAVVSGGIFVAVNWLALVVRVGAIVVDALSGEIDGYRG
jgi:hypothetical protein